MKTLRWISTAELAAFTAAGTEAHRLCTGPDAWIERFGGNLLLSWKNEPARDEALAALDEWLAETALPVARVSKCLPRLNDERAAPALLRGNPALPLATVVAENGARYGLDFGAGYSAGLFIDQRHNRAALRRLAPQRLLNTFAFTCSFSVAAALGGARETLSIDLSKKSLERGKANFALNALPLEGHRFWAEDALEALPRLARKGERFDAIVLDPPTFSRSHSGRRWQVEKGIEDLLIAALELATPRARLLLATNCARLDAPALERMARFVLKMQRRAGDLRHEPNLPDVPNDAAPTSLWLALR